MPADPSQTAKQRRPSSVHRLLIAIPTRERPIGLARVLRSLDRCHRPEGLEVETIVIDNNPDGDARCTLDHLELRHPVRYLHEPRTGIPFARNAALDAATDHDLLAFVDDDETVEPGWIEGLWTAIVDHQADVVIGPVVTAFPRQSPAWIRELPAHRDRGTEDGTRVRSANTGNLMLRTAALGRHHLRFDETFPLLGGTDTKLFSSLHRAGGTIVWTERAPVTEHPPRSRATLRWYVRRCFRTGYAHAAHARHERGIWPSILPELARFGYRMMNAVRLLPTALWRGRPGLARSAGHGAAALGGLAALAGIRFEEYRNVDGE